MANKKISTNKVYKNKDIIKKETPIPKWAIRLDKNY